MYSILIHMFSILDKHLGELSEVLQLDDVFVTVHNYGESNGYTPTNSVTM